SRLSETSDRVEESVTPGDNTPASRPRAKLDKEGRAERNFLAQCLASPSIGREALAAIDISSTFSSDLMRRAAEHLGLRLTPGDSKPPADEDLSTAVAEISVLAGETRASTAALEAERLQLELLALDRDLAAAKAAGAPYNELSARRQTLQRRVSDAHGR